MGRRTRTLKYSRTLNDSQKRHAAKIGIDIWEYQQHVINRLDEMHAATRPKTFRDPKNIRIKIEAENPVLVVGAGPSYKKNMEKIKNFRGKIVCFEVNFNPIVVYGIIPDYILTLEVFVTPSFLDLVNLETCKHKTKLIGSASTQPNVIEYARDAGVSSNLLITCC